MKPGKVLCCRFLFAIWGIDRAQNLAKYNRLRVFTQLTNYRNCDYIIHAKCTSEKQKMCTGRVLQFTLGAK